MEQILVFILVLVAIALVILVLLQQGKGADIGASFGSGASNTVFGSQGSGSFLMKLTFGFAVLFFVICLVLARMAVMQSHATQSVNLPSSQSQTIHTKKTTSSNIPVVPSKTASTSTTSVPTLPKKN